MSDVQQIIVMPGSRDNLVRCDKILKESGWVKPSDNGLRSLLDEELVYFRLEKYYNQVEAQEEMVVRRGTVESIRTGDLDLEIFLDIVKGFPVLFIRPDGSARLVCTKSELSSLAEVYIF